MKKILFITKNFPPQKGGIESYSFDLFTHLSKHTKVFLIANTYGKRFIPIFGLIILLRGIFITPKSDIIYLGDGSLALFGIILGKIYKKEVYCTIHGLDITWKNKIYQRLFVPIIQKCDKIIAVSENTKRLCIEKGINSKKITVISNGISFESLPPPEKKSKKTILNKYNIIDFENKKILLSVARFVERKGIHTFLENIYSKLHQDDYIYILAGLGKYEEIYRKIIAKKQLNNVYIIGSVNSQDKANLYNLSDTFVMPNIEVDGDVEGFGITAIEAGYYNLPVIATKREGLIDAIIDGKTGILIDEGKTRNSIWINLLEKKLSSKLEEKDISNIITKNFSWDIVIKKYLEITR